MTSWTEVSRVSIDKQVQYTVSPSILKVREKRETIEFSQQGSPEESTRVTVRPQNKKKEEY